MVHLFGRFTLLLRFRIDRVWLRREDSRLTEKFLLKQIAVRSDPSPLPYRESGGPQPTADDPRLPAPYGSDGRQCLPTSEFDRSRCGPDAIGAAPPGRCGRCRDACAYCIWT